MELEASDIALLSVPIANGIRYCFDDTYIVDVAAYEQNPLIIGSLNRPWFLNETTPAIEQMNRMLPHGNRALVKRVFDTSSIDANQWNIPSRYTNMSEIDVLNIALDSQQNKGITTDIPIRERRIALELTAFVKRGLLPVLRLMCYIVDTLTAHNIVWGVGRGSSVSSYLLFLLQVHDVDSIKYGLNFSDFIKD